MSLRILRMHLAKVGAQFLEDALRAIIFRLKVSLSLPIPFSLSDC